MSGTNFLDIVARSPDFKVEDADATSTLSQITFKEAGEILELNTYLKHSFPFQRGDGRINA